MADDQPTVPEQDEVAPTEDVTPEAPEEVEDIDRDKPLEELPPELDSSATTDSSILQPLQSTPSHARTIPKIPHNPEFLKPFESGWRRELVFRNPTGDSRRRVDVYYYTPSGQKLRSMKSLGENLEDTDTDLTLDNFTFAKATLGVDDPDKEVVRDAKRSSEESSSSAPAKRRKTLPKVRKSCQLRGTPRVVLRTPAQAGPLGESPDQEACTWLPPLWGKLLTILNRQY